MMKSCGGREIKEQRTKNKEQRTKKKIKDERMVTGLRLRSA